VALEPWQWALGALCALLVGMAKTGIPGLGILVVPVMVYVVGEPRLAPGALLPLLCAADLFAVAYYRRHAVVWRLWELFPWVAIGIVAGSVVLWTIAGERLRPLVGAIVLVMVLAHVARKVLPSEVTPDWRRAAVFGITAGFATTIANAAGPVMNLYLLSMALPKDEFMGTGAWYFLIVNLIKVPIYIYQKEPMITMDTLRFDAVLLPAVVVGALCGRFLYAHIPQRAFEWTVLSLAAVAACSLLIPR
jgi:uncharacterized protein